MPPFTRRQLLQRARALAVLALASPYAGRTVRASAALGYPFGLGVASGEPGADGFVLWTRLVPDRPGSALPAAAVPVRWLVASDPGMRQPVRSGEALARPDHAHSVHVEVDGLQPDRPYWYRFIAGAEASPIGRTRTFPRPGTPAARMRIAWASCQHFGQGHFNAYRDLLAGDPDLVLHLGDYVYESTWGARVRPHPAEPYTLQAYRELHALYRSDAALQAAHAALPWAVTWDDHEVDNDYAGAFDGRHAEPQAAFVRRRAAAYRAYYEHMPLRLTARPQGTRMQLYRALRFGDLATIAVLDNRQYRDNQVCPVPGKHGGRMVVDCAARHDTARSMLGAAQERWLASTLAAPGSRWRIIAQQQLMAELVQDEPGDPRERRWSDGWDGYAATRARLLTHIEQSAIANVVVLGGDIHQYWVTDLRADNRDERAPALATEFVTTSVTSRSSGWAERFLAANPQVRFHAWRQRGYMRAELTHARWRTELRVVPGVDRAHERASTLAAFVVESDRPGAVRD